MGQKITEEIGETGSFPVQGEEKINITDIPLEVWEACAEVDRMIKENKQKLLN